MASLEAPGPKMTGHSRMFAWARLWITGLALAIQCAAPLAATTEVTPGVHGVIADSTRTKQDCIDGWTRAPIQVRFEGLAPEALTHIR
jgi:hypothetical protein